MGHIPYGRQDIDDADVAAVVEVLRSDWLTQGPTIPRFERAVADYCGAAHAAALNSATSALHAAMGALGVGPGDTVWTAPNSFVASANCARYYGADVDFVDIDRDSYNMDPAALEAKLAATVRAGKRPPKAIVPVHFSGQPCDMRRISEVARPYGCAIVEDASHAIGAQRDGERTGECRHSDLTVFSFHPVKIVTTAEGGMVVTQQPALHERVALLRSHGITRDPARMDGPSEGAWYYQQVDLGFNYRLTDIQAALGLAQMRRIDGFVARRRVLADRYDRLLEGLPVRRPVRQPGTASAWHLYVIRVEGDRTRREVFDALRAADIGVNVHYIPIHLQPYYRSLGFKRGDFPVAEWYYEDAISLPMYATLTDDQQDRVVEALERALR